MAYVSNVLTHWIGRNQINDDERYKILTEKILNKQELLYSICDIPFFSKYGGINPKAWSLPMVCFTDIPFSETEVHCGKYSKFGISFSKEHMTNLCVAPVYYGLQPFIYQAYSDLYHTLVGMKEYDGVVFSQGKKKGELFSVDKALQSLHAFIALSQNYSENFEFEYDPKSLNPLTKMENIFGVHDSYNEREWRSIYRNGDKFVWNNTRDGNNYFRFSLNSVKYIIVPRDYHEKLFLYLKSDAKFDILPSVLVYEDLKYL